MTDAPNAEFGNTQALTHMIDSMQKRQLEVKHAGTSLEIGQKLGSGGTKTVYEANIESKPFALALPNVVDGVDKMIQKWQVALCEPENTARVRALGLLANPIYEALPIDINGVPFTAFKMTRYQDLPFQIMDGKNSNSSTVQGNVLPVELDDVTFEEFFGNITDDVNSMILNGLRVGLDSVNICIVNDIPRIFLSDLGNAQFEPFSQEDMPAQAERYVSYALSAFQNGLTEEEYQRHKAFFDSEPFKFNNPDSVTRKIAKKVSLKINDTEHTDTN